VRLGRDDGNAMVEFIALAVVLLIPLVYAVLTALTVERAAYAVTAAAREAGRVYIRDGADAQAYAAAFTAADVAMRDQGLDLAPGDLVIFCNDDPCDAAGAILHVEIDRTVPLPLVPTVGGRPSIAVHGRHDEVVDCFAAGTAAPAPRSTCP